ncbi:spermine/spermidine synthase domain-containing protein [Paenibacillus alkalitolerans]|uniref:spermine/spermidine synthase domain-containing protein n=1 Tax=Paenibacillus alkalitolerans TaxID=2799335 RepID=UPI001F16DAF9|nr:hypothetical protein [Paenibacillus alkalitolerans]
MAEALNYTNVQRVTVVEIEEKIIQWNKIYLSSFSGSTLDNAKTKIVNDDMIWWMFQTEDKFDVVCLDIDNGPDWTVFESNNSLYREEGLAAVSRLLRPNGVISFWSASASPIFKRRLQEYFADVEEIAVELGHNVAPDFIYIAKR